VENGMRNEPQRCGSPEFKAERQSDHTDAESCAEQHLDNPDRRHHVSHSRAAHDHSWMPVNQRIVDFARFFIGRFAWKQ